MQDCMNREQMELASASTSAAVPAATRRGPVAALIAAVIVAARYCSQCLLLRTLRMKLQVARKAPNRKKSCYQGLIAARR